MLEISLNMYHAVALGAFLFWLGGVITSKISLLNRYCIPAPLVGGLCFSIVNCILYSTGAASITFDDTLQSVFMIMFFTTVGFTVSIPALLKGGKAVVLCLLVAVVVRNVMDGMKVEYPAEEIDTMGNMFLSIFLAMALAGLKLWELVDLALPMILCLVAQCVVMVLFSYFVVFRAMGRNYDAAVMTAGFIGFSMGATSNAMANMQVVTKKYGPSPVAYFAIPMVGGMFIDFFNAVLITFNIGLWAH